MPPLAWSIDPASVIQTFELRRKCPSAGALFAWAARTVEGLHYLDDIDRRYDTSHAVVDGHRSDVADVAHARWATGTCITALDLCAAGLGRSFCAYTGPHEFSLTDFDLSLASKKQARVRRRWRRHLPVQATRWVDAVCSDADYRKIKEARNWLVHSRPTAHYTLAIGGPPIRLKLAVASGKPLEVRHIIELARDVATRHVTTFLSLLVVI